MLTLLLAELFTIIFNDFKKALNNNNYKRESQDEWKALFPRDYWAGNFSDIKACSEISSYF